MRSEAKSAEALCEGGKTSEGTINVKTLQRNDGHTEVVITANDENSEKALDALKNIIVGTYPKSFCTGELIGNIKEIRITIPTEEEVKEAQLAYSTNPPISGTI